MRICAIATRRSTTTASLTKWSGIASARLGVTGKVNENTKYTFGLATGSSKAACTTNQNLEDAFSSQEIWLDLAYLDYTAPAVEGLILFGGKSTYPFFRPGKSDLVSKIAAAPREQAQGIDQVNTAVAQMDKVTQQNAANAEESTSASQELTAQAQTLEKMVAQQVALVGGGSKRSRNNDAGAHAQPTTGSARRLGRSDETWYQIAQDQSSEKKLVGARSHSAANSIPLDDDADLQGFNN